MRALLLGRVLRRERYNVLVSYENSVYLGLVKKKVWEQDKVLVNDRVWFEPITDTEVSVERTAAGRIISSGHLWQTWIACLCAFFQESSV